MIENNNKIEVLAADDHPLILRGLTDYLNEFEEINNIYGAKNGKVALDVLKQNKIDIAIIDQNMPEVDGLEVLKEIVKNYPKIKVIMLAFESDMDIKEALKHGAMGLISKESAIEDLKIAIKRVINGQKFVSESISYYLIEQYTDTLKAEHREVKITERELEILKLIAKGKTIRDIARTLVVSPRTIEKHKANIKMKCNVQNDAHLITYAVNNNLLNE